MHKPRWATLQWRNTNLSISSYIRYCRIEEDGNTSITHYPSLNAAVEIWHRRDGTYDFDTFNKSIRDLSPVEIECLLMEMWP